MLIRHLHRVVAPAAILILSFVVALMVPSSTIGSTTFDRKSPTGEFGAVAPSISRTVGTHSQLEAPLQAVGSADLAVDEVIVTQAVNNEPLVVGKLTVVRALIATGSATGHAARVIVDFDGKSFTEEVRVEPPMTIVNIPVDAPTDLSSVQVSVQVEPIPPDSDPDLTNNTKSARIPVVKPAEKIIAFFLPVDWTPELRERYRFETMFPKFVEDNATFLRGAYPLAANQIEVHHTLQPHMLAANEKRLATYTGDSDMVSTHLLYASIALAARRHRPDATLVVGVLPPGWYAKHGNPSALGLALADVNGTVTAQYVLTDATTSAHELAHLYWLYEDYDFAVTPTRPYTWLDRSGFFVQNNEPKDISGSNQIPTFLSAYSPDKPSWVDTRIYEYLMAKFTIDKNGEASEPMVMAATLARQVEPDGKDYPSDYSAGFQRFEPKQTVYVSVAVIGMRGGEKLEARWFLGDRQVLADSKTVEPGAGWYAFSLRNRSGMPEGRYRVEVYLDGVLKKTSKFEVKKSG